mgnify:CR=1 FL=1
MKRQLIPRTRRVLGTSLLVFGAVSLGACDTPPSTSLDDSVRGLMEEAGADELVSAMENQKVIRRGPSTHRAPTEALFFIDGKRVTVEEVDALDPEKVGGFQFWAGEDAKARFGLKSDNPLVGEFTLKKDRPTRRDS